MLEVKSYEENFGAFVAIMQSALIKTVSYIEDLSPTFNKGLLPFDFRYCDYIIIATDKSTFSVSTTMTSSAIETFWVEQVDPEKEVHSSRLINSHAREVSWEVGYDNLPFKITIDWGSDLLILFAAEIYDNADDGWDIKIQDEMLLVFENRIEAEKFEALKNYA